MTYDGNERCDWERCPGYPDDGEEMVSDESGEYHPECRDALMNEEAAYWHGRFAGRREPLEPIAALTSPDEFVDDLMDRGDRLRTARREGAL